MFPVTWSLPSEAFQQAAISAVIPDAALVCCLLLVLHIAFPILAPFGRPNCRIGAPLPSAIVRSSCRPMWASQYWRHICGAKKAPEVCLAKQIIEGALCNNHAAESCPRRSKLKSRHCWCSTSGSEDRLPTDVRSWFPTACAVHVKLRIPYKYCAQQFSMLLLKPGHV